MPRLSTIIPHQGSDSALENTILSVLENQPRDCEVIVVHNGSYSDPYQLSDELMLIEEPTDNAVRLLNAGLVAACAPVICVLSGGASVSGNGWADAALGLFEGVSSQVATAAVATQCGNHQNYGISQQAVSDSACLQRGQVDLRKAENPAAPNLICGFYDRRTLLALDGWNEQLCWENADLELAVLMDRLGIHCQLIDVQVSFEQHFARSQSNATVKQMAEIAVAYGLSGSGASAAMTDLLRGCLAGNISGAVAWATGLMSARGAPQLQSRSRQAEAKYAQLLEDQQLAQSSLSLRYRRAG